LHFGDLERHIIVDAGSGIRALGHDLMTRCSRKPGQPIEIFITHTHWDHIQGFPFFPPIYDPRMEIRVYGPAMGDNETLTDAMAGQLAYHYFPVRRAELSASIEYTELKEGIFDLGGDLTLNTKYLNHPLRCLGYRFTYRDKTVCTAYDTEPVRNLFGADPDDPSYDEAMATEGQVAADEYNRSIAGFCANADVLIHDAQYTEEEYASSREGWGHTSIEHAIAEGRRNGVKRLVLFHHEPLRTDEKMDQLVKTHGITGDSGSSTVCFAREGMALEV